MSLSEPDDMHPGEESDVDPAELVLPASAMSAEELAERAAALEVWACSLGARELRLAQRELMVEALVAAVEAVAGVRPAWSLPASPVGDQIRQLIIETGDDLATVARGIGLEPEWAAGVLVGEITEVDLDHIHRVCTGLHCSPYDLWGVDGGRAIAHGYGPELWPRYIEPLEPVEPLDWIDDLFG